MSNDCYNSLTIENLTYNQKYRIFYLFKQEKFIRSFDKDADPRDASDVHFNCTLSNSEDNSFDASFYTAWQPPYVALEECSKEFPDAIFTLEYYEPGMDFFGGSVFKGGEFHYIEESISEHRDKWFSKNHPDLDEDSVDEDEDYDEVCEELWNDVEGDVFNEFSKSNATIIDDLRNGKIKTGMTEKQCRLSWGMPTTSYTNIAGYDKVLQYGDAGNSQNLYFKKDKLELIK